MVVERRTTERVAMWERLVLMIAAPLIVAAIVAVYAKIDTLEDRLQGIGTSAAVSSAQLVDLRDRMGGLYTVRQADAEHARIFRTDKDQYDRLEHHERRLRRIEGRLHSAGR